jgi:hypothetical protein
MYASGVKSIEGFGTGVGAAADICARSTVKMNEKSMGRASKCEAVNLSLSSLYDPEINRHYERVTPELRNVVIRRAPARQRFRFLFMTRRYRVGAPGPHGRKFHAEMVFVCGNRAATANANAQSILAIEVLSP